MKAKSKKKLFNLIMVVLIALVAFCALMAVGNIKGWFGENSESELRSTEIKGVANMERKGVAYTLEKDVPISAGDLLETKSASEAAFDFSGRSNFYIGENTEIIIEDCSNDNLSAIINEGEIFFESDNEASTFSLSFGKSRLIANNSILAVSSQKGSHELRVFSGSITFEGQDKEMSKEIKAGNKLLIIDGKNDETVKEKIQTSEMSEFYINRLLASKSDDICIPRNELEKVLADREKEAKVAQEEIQKEVISMEGEDGSWDSTDGKQVASKDIKTCTIQIQCTSILKNMDKLKDGKSRYVPSNGVILATSRVEFKKGDTAYDVTKRVCQAAGIQIEAAYTPAYGSYYVEGINHLYEFDCGETSGWMYKVNGWAPNYGCSEYTLEDGDNIVWYYTCSGR